MFVRHRGAQARGSSPASLGSSNKGLWACGILLGMQTPLFVRPLTADERATLETGLRSASAFTVRRCQILLASAEGQSTTTIRTTCTAPTRPCAIRCMRSPARSPDAGAAIVTSTHDGHDLRCGHLRVPPGAVAPESTDVRPAYQPVDTGAGCRGLFRRGVDAAARQRRAIRVALRRLGVSWKRAKHWITSPDPAYARKKNGATS